MFRILDQCIASSLACWYMVTASLARRRKVDIGAMEQVVGFLCFVVLKMCDYGSQSYLALTGERINGSLKAKSDKHNFGLDECNTPTDLEYVKYSVFFMR